MDDKSQLSEVVNSDLAKMESAINNILTVRSKVGAMQNRMDSAKRLNEDQNMNLTDILSHNEDVDVVEKIHRICHNGYSIYVSTTNQCTKYYNHHLLII